MYQPFRLAVLTLGLALLTACGTDQPSAPDVASMATGAASASPAPSAEERPLIRTDASNEEKDRLWNEYNRCLADHGLTKEQQDRAQKGDPSAQAGLQACANKEPEQVWERAKRTDPNYNDKLRDWVTCVRAAGIDAWEENGFIAFKSLPPDDQMRKVDDCQDKAFGKG
ncbi:hypothetical protein ACPPVO_47685 [Dactylosporangium sp. McL0621]|uniref:hypothetical protein n=1 Tax=Dactylosporangium sp. McL0621 TaxID=3415678 RepID=UPI003CE790EF